jgi:hypothetical protein
VDNNIKVEEMVRKYERSRKLLLIMVRDKSKQAIVVSPSKAKKAAKLFSRSYLSHISVHVEEKEPNHNQFQTQNSVYMQPLYTQTAENFLLKMKKIM